MSATHKTYAWITGKSYAVMALTAKLPMPGYEKMTSTTAVPPKSDPMDKPRSVISGSMEPEIPVGSIAYVKPVDPVTIEEGDIILYVTEGAEILHRVVSNHKLEGYLITKGDANEEEDIKEVRYASVRGLVEKHYPVVGQMMMILANTLGKVLLLCLALCGVLLNVLAGRMREEG